MSAVSEKAFNFDDQDTEARARGWLIDGPYLVLLARQVVLPGIPGPVSELCVIHGRSVRHDSAIYVRPPHRSARNRGTAAIEESKKVGQARGWRRLEVTTAPLAAVRTDAGILPTPWIPHLGRSQAKVILAMKPVIQLERAGCGIASVAALAVLVTRRHVKQRVCLGIRAEDHRLSSETTPVRRLLKRYRLRGSSKEQRFRSWAALPKRSLLAIKWRRIRGRACWHWVVRVKDGSTYVLDSSPLLKRHMRTDFRRMKPKWFIAVQRLPSRSGLAP